MKTAVMMKFFPKILCAGLALAPFATLAQEEPDASGLGLETCELVVPGTPLSTVGQCGWLQRPERMVMVIVGMMLGRPVLAAESV